MMEYYVCVILYKGVFINRDVMVNSKSVLVASVQEWTPIFPSG